MARYTVCPNCGKSLHASEINGNYCSCGATWEDYQEGGDNEDIIIPDPEPDPEPDIPEPDIPDPEPEPDIPDPEPDPEPEPDIPSEPEYSFQVYYDYPDADIDFELTGDPGWHMDLYPSNNSSHTIINCPYDNVDGSKFKYWLEVETSEIYYPGQTIIVKADYSFMAVWGDTPGSDNEDDIVTTPVGPYTLRLTGYSDIGEWLFGYYNGEEIILTVTSSPFKIRDDLYLSVGSYTFEGWTTEKGSTNVISRKQHGQDSEGEYFYLVDVNSDMTLYPVIVPYAETHFIEYYIGDDAYCYEAEHDGYSWLQGFKSGESVTIPHYIPERSGYTFLGWSTTPNTTTPQYQSNQTITPQGDMSLWAVWEAAPTWYLLEYYLGAGTCKEAEDDGYAWLEGFVEGSTITITEYVPTLDGHTFLGWSYQPDASTPNHTPGQEITLSGDTCLYAVYVPISSGSLYLKVEDKLVKGASFVKVAGSYRRGTGVFTKVNGHWKRSISS